ncbi:lipoprotein [Streptomyces salyersiae]|uniref:Lipoprotein n=1 Tax=Streptomyces salyersiae TaxID=3075530 RepID=A0ABU2RXZ2_9ACTN|nr:lipoprotein [Streptomyces sp. DSM 41770]MDT0432448.1 lipoprotein [Streptomyces sp. DSM 41770]
MRRGAGRALAGVVLAAAVLAGCSSSADEGDEGDDHGARTSSSSSSDATAKNGDRGTGRPAVKGLTLGGPGSSCALPVTFDLAKDWKPQAVEVEPGSELAELGEQGTVTLVCDIDAKPAGNLGYLRVWAGKEGGGDPRAALEAFVADEPNAAKAAYTETEAGSVAAVEVAYTVDGDLPGGSKPERAFAVATPEGPVVVHLGGMDEEEHRQMLPAYELARESLKLG